MTSAARALFPAACGGVATSIGAAGLLGWIANRPMLTQFRSDSIPIAPNTAAGFLIMGASLMTLSLSTSKRLRLVAAAFASFVAGLTCLRLLEFLVGRDFGVDRWLLSVPAGTYGLAPVGKMALFTAATLLLAGVSGVFLAADRSKRRSVGGVMGLAVALIGSTFALGFVVGAQVPAAGAESVLALRQSAIPMAFSTAIGFIVLGVGLAAAAGPHAFPLRPFLGTSVRARLFRVFLPLTAAAAFVSALLANAFARADSPYRAITTSAVAVGAALAAAVICVRIAGGVGAELEQAEQKLRRARDELEDRVYERTSQLSMTATDLNIAVEEVSHANDELRRTQAQLVQAEKLAGLGQLVAGVAHEINNPLAFVNNNFAVLEEYTEDLASVLALYRRADVDLTKLRPELAAEIGETVERVQLEYVLENTSDVFARSKDGLKRIMQIVKDLREFARLDRSERESADVNHGVESTINIIRGRAHKRRIDLSLELGRVPNVSCYPAKINQVVMNLVSNAIDACSDGGHVAVRTRPAKGGIQIEVQDDGCGIEPAIRDKLFDPFFTTKPVGQGTGLGLSISYGIVQDHAGKLDLTSEPGKGTTFTVFLPIGSAK